MISSPIQRLLREWVALVAIFAMVLGPLALATSRSLSAQERVNIAAGLTALPMCVAGDSIDGLASKTGGGSCDHCLPIAGGVLPSLAEMMLDDRPVATLTASIDQITFLAYRALPPATGPPVL
ncbi:MAG: hypothetical protein ACRCWF_01185 [Beijerinckiaceae bacterium]